MKLAKRKKAPLSRFPNLNHGSDLENEKGGLFCVLTIWCNFLRAHALTYKRRKTETGRHRKKMQKKKPRSDFSFPDKRKGKVRTGLFFRIFFDILFSPNFSCVCDCVLAENIIRLVRTRKSPLPRHFPESEPLFRFENDEEGGFFAFDQFNATGITSEVLVPRYR